MVARNAGARKRPHPDYVVKSGRMQMRRGYMLGAPGRARAAHVMLFRPIGMERGNDELPPELANFADQSGLGGTAVDSR